MTDFLHGVESKEVESNNFTIQDADISSVAVIGTMPTYEIENQSRSAYGSSTSEAPKTPAHAARKVTKIVNYNYTGDIGNNIEGFTIPEAVQTILDLSGGANIYCINVFDNDKHTASVDKSITFTDDICILSETGVQNLVLKQGEDKLELGKDYEFDAKTGKITILEGGALEDDQTNVTASYKYVDFTKVTDTDIIGSTDANNVRTGIQAIWDIVAEYGVVPGIIIAPGFSSKNVRTAIETISERLRAFSNVDVPKGTNVNLMEKARFKPVEDIDLTTSSRRSMLSGPWMDRYNQYENVTTLKPLSPVAAGLRVKLDRERNCAKSISNTPISIAKGMEFPISFMLDDPATDSNRINALGIATVINYKGVYYFWGARNSSFPSKSGIKTFEHVTRTTDFIIKSIQDSQFVCVAEKITRGFIDDIIAKINDKFAAWASGDDPLIYGGEAYFDDTLNTAENISDGHLYLPWDYCPVGCAERITNLPHLDIKIITKSLVG